MEFGTGLYGRWCPADGKATVGLASQWPQSTDFSGLPTYGSRPKMGTFLVLYDTLYLTLGLGSGTGAADVRDGDVRGGMCAGGECRTFWRDGGRRVASFYSILGHSLYTCRYSVKPDRHAPPLPGRTVLNRPWTHANNSTASADASCTSVVISRAGCLAELHVM